jgi:DNA mismatch endonuclease (patch repair protein)
MADFLSRKKRSALMSRIKSSANKTTELQTIRLLRVSGLHGWRRRVTLSGKPDFVWREKKVVLFVDGCFWHRCPKHGHIPRSRANYWLPKLTRNQQRDRKVARHLRKSGWRVVRLWECLLRQHPRACINRIQRALASPREGVDPRSSFLQGNNELASAFCP